MTGLLALTALTSALHMQVDEAKAKVEAKVMAALTATKLNFTKSESGLSFVGEFDHLNGRKRRIYIATGATTLQNIQSHVVYTTVLVCGKTPPSEKQLLLTASSARKLGAFYLYKDKADVYAIRFSAHFDSALLSPNPSSTDPTVENLKDLIYFVNQVGEEASLLLEKGD
ncbi:MAG: hypothetical protein ABL949_01605 [Fimbriimonadaceae bacterium]